MKAGLERHKNFPSLTQALLVLMILLAIEILIGSAYIDLFGRFEPGDVVAGVVVAVLANGVVFASLMTWKRLSFADLFHPGQTSKRAVVLLLTPPIVLFAFGESILMDDLMSLVLVLLPMTQEQYDMFARLTGDGLASLILLCVVAPFLEEMLFRGVFLRSFLQQYSPVQAMVFSSALFGIAHLNIYQGLSAFIGGMMLAWLYMRAKSLWPCIIAHAAFNLSCVVLNAMTAGSAPESSTLAPLPMQLTAMVFVAVGGYVLWKLLGVRGTASAASARESGE